jgi:hypothetical protein
MDAQLRRWKSAVERLWSADVFDCREALQLATEIARQAGEPALQQAAAQALASLRDACVKGAEQRKINVAQRRVAAIRNALHVLTAPRFGKRGSTERPLTAEERHRRLLGLPLGRRLYGPEISQAYKRAAKKVHPDAGGSPHAFQELSAARDALRKAL